MKKLHPGWIALWATAVMVGVIFANLFLGKPWLEPNDLLILFGFLLGCWMTRRCS